jgi:hypothetical protein
VTTTCTTRPFERSHGKAPRGFGHWAFAPSTTRDAFDHQVNHDAVEFFTGRFAEARAQAVAHFADAEFVAAMP